MIKEFLHPEGELDRRVADRRKTDRIRRWSRHFWLAVLTGLYLWSVLSLQSQVNTEAHDRRAAIAANVRARRDDCAESNKLRGALRLIVRQAHASLPAIYKLFPQLDNSGFRAQQERIYRFQLQAFSARNCEAYAREVRP